MEYPCSLHKLRFPFIFSQASLKTPPPLLLFLCLGGQIVAINRAPLFWVLFGAPLSGLSVVVSCLTRGVFLIICSLCSSLVRNRLAPSSLQALRDSSIFWSRSKSYLASYTGKTATLLGQQPQFSMLQIRSTDPFAT